MRSSHILAVILAVGVVAWVLSGTLDEKLPAAESLTVAARPEAPEPTQVRVAASTAQAYRLELVLTGQTAAGRVVPLNAQTYGRIESVAVKEGALVEAGAEIARLALDDRLERLEKAKSGVRQFEIEHEASVELARGGWRTEAAAAQARANLDRARAELAAIELEISRTRIVSPISGILEHSELEIGKVVFTGANNDFGEIVDLDPLTVVAHVSERQVARLAAGSTGTVELITGELLNGTVRFVGRLADPQTRTYRIELEAPNPGHVIRAGMTAVVKLPLKSVPSHFVSPSVLTLDDQGVLGVKIVDDGNIVRFLPVSIIAAEAGGYHVGGLPPSLTLITVGQDFVLDGETVTPVHVDGSPFSGTS